MADRFTQDSVMLEGGAERHLMQLALAMRDAGIECCVYQPGDRPVIEVVGGVEVRTRPIRRYRLWSGLARHARAEGWTHLYFKYLEHVPSGLPREQVTATQHGVHWDIPYEAHGKPWYPGGAAARGILPAWRAWQIAKTFAGLRRCTAVSAMDTSFLRITQALSPGLRGRIYVTPPFSDLSPPSASTGLSTGLPGDLGQRIAAVRASGGVVVLVPRNVSLVRGESWLPEIFARVAAERPVLFIVTGVFLGRLDKTWRSARLQTASVAASTASCTDPSSLVLLCGCPHDTMPVLYEAADIVLVPTFAHEGACLAAAEAMTFSRPVVATSVGGLNDTLDDGWTGIVARPDPASIAGAVLQLAADPAARTTFAEQAYLRAAACFSLGHWRDAQLPFFTAAGWLGGGHG